MTLDARLKEIGDKIICEIRAHRDYQHAGFIHKYDCENISKERCDCHVRQLALALDAYDRLASLDAESEGR